MAKYGRNSLTVNSRHVNIRHFFVKDIVDKGEIEVICFTTHLMIAGYFTRPMQGGGGVQNNS